jgi:hypothetical protein
MCGKIAERFGELMGRLAAIDPAAERAMRGEAFKFAAEKRAADDEPAELLPNWRVGKAIIN